MDHGKHPISARDYNADRDRMRLCLWLRPRSTTARTLRSTEIMNVGRNSKGV
jgi:hypothetical protein